MLTIALLVAIAYLPGAIIFRLPIADRAKRAALPAEERVFWAVVLSIAVSMTIAFLLAAMSMYSLHWVAGINVVGSVILAAASLGNLRLGSAAPRPQWTAALPAALIVLGAWMFFAVPASEWVLGGRDPGVYMNSGIQIAQRQSLVTIDRVIADVPPAMRDLFFPYTRQPGYYGDRFMGFQIRDPDAGTVTALFPQGFPISIAIAYGVDGVTGTRRVVAWWAILGGLAVYFAAARLLGPVPAAAAAGLLTVHVVQTWYARYPNSEIVTQALLFSALLAHAYAHEEDDTFFGPVAASLLGIALFTRFPMIVAIGAAVVASLLAHVSGHRTRAGFLVTLTAWAGAASVYYLTQLRPYFTRPITYFHRLQPIHFVALTIAAAGVLVLLWAIRRPRVAAATRKWLPIALVVAVIVGSVYALFFREPGGRLAPHDAHSLKVFVYLYFTLTAFALALVGYTLVVSRSFWRAPALILALTTMAFFFFYKMRVWPEHFWLARRFVDALLPGALMFTCAALFAPAWLPRMGSAPRTNKGVRHLLTAAGIVVVIFLGQRYLAASQPIRTHIEYADVIPRIERLAAGFGDNDLVIVEGRAASDLHTLALPLAYIWSRNVLVMYSSRPDKPQLVEFLAWARKKYDNVYFIGGGGTDLLSPGIRLETVKSEAFAIPQYDLTHYAEYPTKTRMKPFNLTVYRFVEGPAEEGAFSIDVGAADDVNVIRFHGKERWGADGTTFRWTTDRSYFSVPKVTANDHELIVRMGRGRPANVPSPRVNIFLADRQIGKAEVDGHFRDYVFTIPADLAAQLSKRPGAAEIRVESTTWTPKDVLGNSDERKLGVMIDRAEIR